MILSTFFIIFAYLMGSICSAVIVCKTFALPDPRTEGSQNPGATNVLRIAGKKYAVIVLITDILKGTIPVAIAQMFITDSMVLGFVALAAVIGHMYPVFFDFKGGKGVATAIGALLGFHFLVGVMVAGTWLLVAKFTRYSSLASIISICLAPVYSLFFISKIDIIPPLFLMAVLILIKHRQNMGRLLEGTEPKIKLKQRSVLEEVMDDEPSAISHLNKEETATEAPVVKAVPESKPVKTEKEPTAKAKTTKKPAVKKAAAAAEKPVAKTAKPAKKPAATKSKTEKPKEK